MDVTQVVILTLLAVVAIVAFCSWVYRMAELQDNTWVEVVILIVVCLFAYLVVK